MIVGDLSEGRRLLVDADGVRGVLRGLRPGQGDVRTRLQPQLFPRNALGPGHRGGRPVLRFGGIGGIPSLRREGIAPVRVPSHEELPAPHGVVAPDDQHAGVLEAGRDAEVGQRAAEDEPRRFRDRLINTRQDQVGREPEVRLPDLEPIGEVRMRLDVEDVVGVGLVQELPPRFEPGQQRLGTAARFRQPDRRSQRVGRGGRTDRVGDSFPCRPRRRRVMGSEKLPQCSFQVNSTRWFGSVTRATATSTWIRSLSDIIQSPAVECSASTDRSRHQNSVLTDPDSFAWKP